MSKQRKRTKRVAKLTPYENKSWVFAFGYYLDRVRSAVRADQLAWRDMLLEFPRLRAFDGCR